MRAIKVLARAKVNFVLDVFGKTEGYHEIASVVSTVGFGDEIVIKKRKDDRISLYVKGTCGCPADENNAFKAAKLFKKTFKTRGFDIYLKKKIPVGSGLGGSSADSAGVLSGLKTLFGIDADMSILANALGSDTAYQLKGGFALIKGRGEEIKKIDAPIKLYLLLCKADGNVITADAYRKFDELGEMQTPYAEKSANLLSEKKTEEFLKTLKNDLFLPAIAILPEVKQNYEKLFSFAPTVMSGSGATVFSVFTDKKERDKVYKLLKPELKNKLIKTETV